MYLIALFIILFSSVNTFSQENKDTVFRMYKYPFREGYIYPFKEQPGRLITYAPGVYIYSKESDVYAYMEGEVTRVFRIDDSDNVLIKKVDTFVVYSNMDVLNVKVGDTVYKGGSIGKAKKDVDMDRYELFFIIMKGNKSLTYVYDFDFLKRYNK